MTIQVQGRFATPNPRGCALFIGGEVRGRELKLGRLASAVVGLAFKMAKLLTNGIVSYSFGNDAEQIDPHMMTSMYHGVDQFVVTPEGEIPPLLGRDLPESEKDKKKRQSSKSTFQLGYV